MHTQEKSLIICKPTSWIKIRMVLVLAMFSVFCYLFYKDGSTGYRQKNEQVVFYELINKVAQEKAKSIASSDEWKNFVSNQKIFLLDETECPLPKGFSRDQPWPKIVAQHYDTIKQANKKYNAAWVEYASFRGWGVEAPEHLEDQSSLNTQYYMAAACLIIVIITATWFAIILGRTMEVTATSYITPRKDQVAFSEMFRIDTRKWDSKGLAFIEYKRDGAVLKTKVDGMIYGQFKEQNGAPAEKLYAFILDNFKGELIEYKSEEEDEDLDQPIS